MRHTIAGPAGKLHADDGGSGGTPVVFIHSLAGNTGQWDAQLSQLRTHRRAVALDLRGHGKSDLPSPAVYTPEAYAADIHAVVSALKLPAFVLVGHSLGTDAVLAYAGAHPARLRGLVLVDAMGDLRMFPAAELKAWLEPFEGDGYAEAIEAHWMRASEGADTAARRRVIADLKATPKAVVVSSLNAATTFDPITPLSRYSGPRLAVATPKNDEAYSIQRVVPDMPHRIIPGTGHWIHMDKPAEFNAMLDAFLRSVDAPAC
jgi:pimeloyl-ACP methyl ester carboxylesterase